MNIPVWVTYAIAGLVIVFGIHRIRISMRTDEQEAAGSQRRGLYGMSRRAHRIIGMLYLALGALLIATAVGWNPFGDLFGPKPTEPAPTKTIPIQTVPPAQK